MPAGEKTDKAMPRSALRYRPIAATGATATRTFVTSGQAPTIARSSRPHPRQADTNIEIKEWLRADHRKEADLHTSPGAYRTRTSRTLHGLPNTRPEPANWKHFTKHQEALYHQSPLLYLGLGMLAAIILWSIIMGIAGWIGTTLDDLRYGRPRTFQTDQVVGHNDSTRSPSHFIVINLHRRIEIFEMPGGDPTHAKVYPGPQLYGANDELTPATITFVDVNGDHKPDMILHVQAAQIVFINDQGGFRPLRANEHAQVEQFLLTHPQAP